MPLLKQFIKNKIYGLLSFIANYIRTAYDQCFYDFLCVYSACRAKIAVLSRRVGPNRARIPLSAIPL